MSAASYHTIETPTEGQYREKGSRFLAFAYPVESEEDIRAMLNLLKKEFFDARHHCYAWMLGPERKSFRAFDDGEPNHSAGDPILGQIRSRNLTNVLVVVVRYFGGIKLGVGGLISAYKAAADEALSKARIIEVEVRSAVRLNFGYAATPEVMRMIREYEAKIIEQDFSADCMMEVTVPVRLKDRLLERIQLLKATGTDLSETVL